MKRREFFADFASNLSRSSASKGPGFYTNAVLRTHNDKPVRFYDDLIKGKHAVINFMYANCEGACPAITANLLKVQKALNGRVGRDIFFYSITLKPEEDTPKALKEYAEMHGVKSGWTFLTGDPHDLTTIRFKLTSMDHPAFDLDIGQHTTTIRVINDPINRWTGCSAQASVGTIKQVILWADPPKPLEERIRENKKIQARIDKMEFLPTWLGSLADD